MDFILHAMGNHRWLLTSWVAWCPGGQNNVTHPLKRCPHLNRWNLCIYYLTWRKGHVDMRGGDYPGLSNVITRIRIKGSQKVRLRKGDVTKDERLQWYRAVRLGMQAVSKAGKSKETDPPSEPLEQMQPCQHPDFGPREHDFRRLTSRTIRE